MAEIRSDRIQRKSVSDQIFDILKEKILTRQWQPGEKIPSEMELAASFGVSRLSARTALQRLSALGLVEIRVGDGTYIKESPLDDLLLEGSDLLMSVRTEDDMGDFRGLFEQGYMILACERRTEEDIALVREILDRMEQHAHAGELEAYLEADNELHRSLCEIARNQYFSVVYKLMEKTFIEQYRINTEYFSHLPQNSLNRKDENYYLLELCRGHRDYLEALIRQDAGICVRYQSSYLRIYKENRHVRRKKQKKAEKA